MNAVMVADGLARGGPEVARTRLADFWRAASIDGDLPVIQRKLLERLLAFVPARRLAGGGVVRRDVALLLAL
jgi:NTE family protein